MKLQVDLQSIRCDTLMLVSAPRNRPLRTLESSEWTFIATLEICYFTQDEQK